MASCVLLASRESNDVCTADEVSKHLPEYHHAKTVLKCSKDMRSKLDIGFMLADPHTYVDNIGEELDASEHDTETAHEIVDVTVEDGVASGRTAGVIAASAFYIAGNFDGGHGKYNQKELAEAADVSTVSIRNTYQEFGKVLRERDDDNSIGV